MRFKLLNIFKIFSKKQVKKEIKVEPTVEVNLVPKKTLTISSQDIAAITGEDVIGTQLDLARAYIETNRKMLAKKILTFVLAQGNPSEQEEARRLLSVI